MFNVASLTKTYDGVIKNEFDIQAGKPHDYDVASDWYVIEDAEHYNAVFDYLTQTDIDYNLCVHSCTGFAQRAANLAGVEIPYAGLLPSPQETANSIEAERNRAK